jgi:chromosome segregation ATPase
VQVPIPAGLELADIDRSDEENETRIIHLRQLISDAQRRVLELEEELAAVRNRRDELEKLRAENVVRLESVGHDLTDIQSSLRRISEVIEAVTGNRKRSVGGEKSLTGYPIGDRP